MPESVFGKTSLLLGGLLFIAAALQYNDPDPWLWIAMYVAAGVASTLGALTAQRRKRQARVVAAAVGLAALTWTAILATTAVPHLTVAHLLESMKAETPAIEESRELFGLLLIGLWMAVLFVRLREAGVRSS